MSTQYPGLPTVARNYWRMYFYAIFGMGSLVIFTGAIAAVIILVVLPSAKWYVAIAALSLIIHMAALFVRDIWIGAYEPSQTTFSSAVQIIAIVTMVGVVNASMLLIGTLGGYALETLLGLPAICALAIAAYYPILDIVLIRRGLYTPGAIIWLLVTTAISMVLDIHESVLEAVPLIGKRKRPQS